MLQTLTGLCLACSLLAFAGCHPTGDHPGADSTQATAPAGPQVPTPAASRQPPASSLQSPAASEDIVRLLDPGAEPRRLLRLRPSLGPSKERVQKLTLTTYVDMEMEVGALKPPKGTTPPLILGLELRVKDVSAEGEVTYTYEFQRTETGEAPGVQPVLAAALRETMKKLTGTVGEVVISDRRIPRKADVKLPPDLDLQARQLLDSLRQSMALMASPFPKDAVGLGARWEVKSSIEQTGVTMDQTTRYTVAELTDSTEAIRVEIEQSAPPQTVKHPGLPQGGKVELQSLSSRGQGELKTSGGLVAPQSGAVEIDVRMEVNMAVGAQPQTAKTHTKLKLEIAAGG